MASSRFFASAVLVVASALTLIPTPAAAVDGLVDQLPFPDFDSNEFVDEQFSSDLSTAAFTRNPAPLIGDPAPNAGITTLIDLSTGELLLLQADRGPSEQQVLQLDGDGSHLLISANWEGVVADDADGGAADLFVVKTDVDDVVSLTAGLDGEIFEAIGMSDDALTVVFSSGDLEGPRQLHVWRNGEIVDTVTDIVAAGDVDFSQPSALSADGTTLLYSTRSDEEVSWHLQELATGDEVTIVAPSVFDVSLSDDGSVVAGSEADFDPNLDRVVVWSTDEDDVSFVEVPTSGAVLSGDGSTVFGSGTDPATQGLVSVAWRLELATGEVETIVETSKRTRGIVAVADDGGAIVLHTVPTAVGIRPVPVNFLDEEIERYFLVDLTAEPAPIPGFSGTLDAQLVRMYNAYFDRAPDAGGLEFWRNQRAAGQGILSVSADFAQSPEFVETYGDLDDEAFVDLVYANVLDRTPDDGGKVFWLEQLADGRARGDVMALFSESPEFIDGTGTLPPENAIAASVRRLYAGYFGRDADPAGLEFWIGQAEEGASLESISNGFRTSDEFSALYDESTGVVNDAYSLAIVGFGNTLGTADVEVAFELSIAEQEGEITLPEVMIAVTNAPEFVALTSSTPISD